MRPLTGVRVLDFFWLGAGPMASTVLGHLGAEVIKIESQARMDKIREGGPYPGAPDPDLAGVFASLNYGKQSLCLDLGHPEAKAIVFDLVRSCDVVTNNFKAHTMARFGLSFEALRAHNPRIVYLTMSTMGAEGPHTAHGAYGSHLAGMAGINATAGYEGEVPIGMGSLFPDYSCNPLHATAAILAGLRHVRATGEAVEVDISQLESTLHLIGPLLQEGALTGEQPRRRGAGHAWRVPHGVYPCAGDDEWLALSVGTDAEWRALAGVIAGSPGDWARHATFIARQRHREEVDAAVRAWTSSREKWVAAGELLAAGVPAWPVNNLRDQLERDPGLHGEFVRAPFADPGSNTGGAADAEGETAAFTVQRVPIAYAGAPAVTRPPRLSEHTFDVLQRVAGYSDERVAELLAAGVLV